MQVDDELLTDIINIHILNKLRTCLETNVCLDMIHTFWKWYNAVQQLTTQTNFHHLQARVADLTSRLVSTKVALAESSYHYAARNKRSCSKRNFEL